jgi:ATP-binding cassette subfamily A (ABC1) protein 3
MAEGRLRCLGSSLFLKKTYGVGYQLTIEKQSDSSKKAPIAVQTEDGIDVVDEATDDKLQDIVEGAVSDATLLTNVGTEMSFQLPLGASSNFKPMFDKLDAEVDAGGIVTYGVGITTLDEVFLLVARGETHEKTDFESSKRLEKVAATADDAEKSMRSRLDLENEGLFTRHVVALFRKRAVNFKRDKKAWVCTTILPCLFVLIGFLLYAFVGPTRNLVPLTLDLDELNVNVDSEPRNPILFNSGNSFSCQPGNCIYEGVFVNESTTGELYSFCGAQAYLGNATSCSIQEYEGIVARITEGGAEPAGYVVDNISEVRALIVVSN